MAIKIPPYQQIVFNQKAQCGRCDTFIYDKDKDLQFQFNSKYENIHTETFENSPYLIIPEGTDWLIDIPPLPIGTLSPIRSTFLLQNEVYTRIFVIYDDAIPASYGAIFDDEDAGVMVVRIKYDANASNMKTRIVNAMSVFGAEIGRTVTTTGTGVRIPNMPAGIGFGFWNMNANINTPNPADFEAKFFADNLIWSPITKKMLWLNFLKYYKNWWEGNGGYLTVNNLDFTELENKLVQVKLRYENTNAFDLQIRLAIKIDGWLLGSSEWYDMTANNSGTITHTRLMPVGYSPSNLPFSAGVGQIELIIQDPTPGNLNSASELSFYIDNINLDAKDILLNIQKKSCNNETENLDYEISDYEENTLVTINNEDLQDAIQLILTDTSNDTYTSNLFQMVDVNSLQCKNLTKIEWTNNCEFGGIDYSNLQFTNELYLNAYLSDVDLRVLDSIFFKNQQGKEINVYELSTQQYELKIALYTSVMHNILQRAFMHSFVAIDNDEYYRSEASKYTKADIENGFYTARITLSKSDTEVVKSLCCY